MVSFLKRLSKNSTLPCDELERKSGSPTSKKNVSKSELHSSSGLKDYHVKTESTEEESYSESYSKSFDSGNNELWETDSNATTDSDTESGTDSGTDSDCSSKISAPKKVRKNRRNKEKEKRHSIKRISYRLQAKKNQEEEKIMKDAHNEACRYLRDGRLVEAKEKFESILTTVVKEYGSDNRRVGAALHNLGIVHLRAGNVNDAVDAIEEAVKIRKSSLGVNHPKVSDSLVELGIVFISQEEFEDAIDMFNEALSIRERQMGKAKKGGIDERQIKQQIAKINNNIGCAYYEYGDTHNAKEVFKETLELQTEISQMSKHKAPIPEMLTMSSIICNIGQVYLENDEWQQASIQFQKALELQESILNSNLAADNDILLATRENLAYSAIMYGSYDFAKQVYKEILLIHESSNDDVDAKEAEAMKNIAFTNIKLYEYDDALEMLTDVQDIHPNLKASTRRKLDRLMAALHYQATKYPAPKELMLRTLTGLGFRSGWNNDLLCKCGGESDEDEINVRVITPKRPSMGTKMSGHKVSFS